jgi:methionine synthase II (cobalamin-independent)
VAKSPFMPTSVHLVGSIGLDSVKDVFRTVGPLLGQRLHRIPDGETGGRRAWIGWQQTVVRVNPFLKIDHDTRSPTLGTPMMALADDVAPGEVRFGELGYAHEARASFQLFVEARRKGTIPKGVRFQVALPTPLAVMCTFVSHRDLEGIEQAYEKAMLREVEDMCAAIPHKDLCIQWDVCNEMLMWDGQFAGFTPPFDDLGEAILSRMKRICRKVPRDVELGIHLCYGDFNARHFAQPRDMTKMVEIANAITKVVARPIAYFHMPVPINRDDEEYFRPLLDLKLGRGAEVYLGLVHADGADKVKARIDAAAKYLPEFGIATECGIARARNPNVVKALLKAHAAVSRAPASVRRSRNSKARRKPQVRSMTETTKR